MKVTSAPPPTDLSYSAPKKNGALNFNSAVMHCILFLREPRNMMDLMIGHTEKFPVFSRPQLTLPISAAGVKMHLLRKTQIRISKEAGHDAVMLMQG